VHDRKVAVRQGGSVIRNRFTIGTRPRSISDTRHRTVFIPCFFHLAEPQWGCEVESTDVKRTRHISFSTRGRRLLAPVAHRFCCALATIRRCSRRPMGISALLSSSCLDCRPVCRRADYLILTVDGVLRLANRRHEPISHPYQLAARTCMRAIRLFSHRKGLFVAPHVLRFRRGSDDRFHPALSEKKGHRGTSSVTSC